MPGIIAIISKNKNLVDRNRKVIKQMTESIIHEDFYSNEYYELPELGLLISNVFITDKSGSFSNNGGFHTIVKQVQCFFSGELYSFREICDRKLINNEINRNDCYASIVEDLYRDRGISVLESLNGFFNLVLVDKVRKVIIIANDRHGMQRFYYGKSLDGSIIFAPELKCYKHYPELPLNLDEYAILNKFKYRCFYKDETFYKEIRLLPIASKVEITNGDWNFSEYWTPKSEDKLSEDDYLKQAQIRFEEIVEDYFDENNTGLSMTGGWDTRAILSVLHNRGKKLPLYTFAGQNRDTNDVKIARKLARITDNPYHKIVLGTEYLENFSKWVEKAVYISDGLSSVTRCQEYYVNLKVRQYGTIRLTGKYGSQLVRGVTLLNDTSPNLQIFSKEYKEKYSNAASISQSIDLPYVLRYELPQLESQAQSQEMAALVVRTPYMDNKFVELMLKAPKMEDTSKLQKLIIAKNTPDWVSFPTNRGNYIRKTKINQIKSRWTKTLNTFDFLYNWERLPKFHMKVFDLMDMFGINSIYKGREYWHHYRIWFRKQLGEYIEQIILDPRTLNRHFYNPQFLEKMVKDHRAGRSNYTREIDKILTFELWLRQHES